MNAGGAELNAAAFRRWLDAGRPTRTYADRQRARHWAHLVALHGDPKTGTAPALNSSGTNLAWLATALENDVKNGIAPAISGLNWDLDLRRTDGSD